MERKRPPAARGDGDARTSFGTDAILFYPHVVGFFERHEMGRKITVRRLDDCS